MCDKAACDRESMCSYLLKKLQDFFHHDKIVGEGDSIKQLTQFIDVVSGCDEGQAYFKALQQYVVQTMIGLLEGSGDHFIFLPPEGDLFNESNALCLLSRLAFQTGDTACLEEIASCYQGYPSDGYLMISVGAMLIQRMKYRPSEKCFLSALSYFEHKQNHLGTVVATVNLAVFHKICGDYRKAQSYCNTAVRLCLDFTRTPATDVHLEVVFRLAILSQELKDYNSNHDILRVAMKFDIDQISDAFVAKYMKQLMTLQLKGLEGEQIKHDKLEELALQLFVADTFIQAQPLTADFIAIVMTLAEMYCTTKCFNEARQLIDKLESTFLHFNGGNCPLFGFLQYQIGHFKFKYGEASDAQSSLLKAEQIYIHFFGIEHHMVGSCKSLQGACALQKGNRKAACYFLKEARIIFEKINPHHQKVGTILLKLADLESEAGNFENAKLTIEEALEMFILSCGKVSLKTALAYLQGASILQRKGKFMRSALDKVKKAKDIFIYHGLHHDHPDVAFCYCLQGQLLHSLGQVKEAEEEFLFVHHQLSSQDDLSMKTCNSDQKLDLHAQTNWEPDSDMLKIGPSVDLSQTEDTKSLSFTAHSEDNIVTDVCVDLLECILRNRHLSLEVQPSHINNGLYTTDGTEEHVNSLLSPGSASSLNCLPLSQYDATNGKQEFMQKALPSLKNVYGETCSGKETGNVSDTSSTSQAIFFSSHYHESAVVKSNCEEGWIEKYDPSSETKDNLPPNEIPQEMCSVQSIEAFSNKDELREDHRMEFDQSPEFPLVTAGRENGKGTITNGNLINELQEEVMFYQDQCHEIREELIKLKEKLKLCEEEKQGLQAEVGRQLFLESKERRCSKKVYQPPSKHASGTSEPVGVRGASHDFSGFLLQKRLQEISHSLSELELNKIKNLVRPILDNCRLARIREFSKLLEELERRGEFSCSFVRDLLERIHRFDLVEKLAEPFHNGEESCIKESYSPQESKQLNEVVESVSGVNSKQCDEVEEGKEIFDNTEVDEEDEVCNNSNVNSFNSDSEGASVTFPAKNVNESSFVGGVDLSEERYDSASSLSQSFDVPNIGLESRERSWSPSFTSKQFDGEKLKGACATSGKRDKEGAHDSSFPHGAERQFYFNHHFNDTVYGAANLPDRAQDSLKQEYLTSVNQDSLPNGDTTQRQNVSGARFIAQKDTATDHSDSRVSNQSNEWEHLGARLQDGTFSSIPRDELFHSGFTGSGLTSDFIQPTGFQIGALNTLDSSLSIHDYALGTREPQIPPDGYFTSLQINQPIHFNGSGFTSDLTGSTRPELTHSATDTHRDSDFSGSASMLPSTRNSGLSVSSSVCKQTYGFPPDASSTSSSGARVNGSDSRLFSESESSRVSQLLPVTTGRDGLITSEEVNSSSNAMNASDDHLASGHYREGSRAYNSSSSHMISGTDTGERQSGQTEDLVTNRNYGTESVESTDNSLLELEQRVEEACAMVERVLREREEREEFGREIERKEREIRAERARKKREREARELEEARGWPQQQEPVTGQSLWLCEHYQRHCRVRFPCCNNFYSCHRCHNNSKECDNEEAKASHATHLKCSYCHHEQEIGEDSVKCRSCKAKMSAYFCAICKHFTSIDKNPYHCKKCGICRIHKDKSFHCEVCNVCHDKHLQGKHKCRPDCGHNECCICLKERETGAKRGLQKTVWVVSSLNANHNSRQSLIEDIEDATLRIEKRWSWFGRWCTCAGGLDDQDSGEICANCFKYKYWGPSRIRRLIDHDKCCICQEDAFRGCQILPCSHKVHRECAIAMIQNGIRTCPVCRYPLYSPAPE